MLSAMSTLLFKGCASMAPPTGGEKDEEPPIVTATVPAQKSTNYNGKIVEMIFDEMITVEGIKQELLITPRIEGNYEYEVKKNRLSLKFDQNFQPNTTYTLNFRNAIKDVTEKNIAENEKIVFSTGNTVDSLYVNGKVTDLLTNKPVENALIMLYQAEDTSNILKHPPYYFTKTDKKGIYALENIRAGKYNIYALVDYNNNLKYELAKEKIAFMREPINILENIDSLGFQVTKIDNEKPKILRAGAETDYYVIEFNEGLTNTKVTSGNNQVYHQLEKDKFIQLYNTFSSNDSIPIQIVAEDSARNILQTDIKVKFNTAGKIKTKPRPFSVETQPKNGDKILKELTYKINFSKPVQRYYLEKIELLADTVTPIPLNVNKDIRWNNSQTQLTVKTQTGNSKLTRIKIPAETFFSIENDTNQRIITNHELKDIEEYGTISGTVNSSEKNFIIQLLNANYDVIAEQFNKAAYKFDYLEAGNYYVRVIIDSNGNGVWDQGNFKENILPERIIFNKSEIPLKQNWEIGGQNITF